MSDPYQPTPRNLEGDPIESRVGDHYRALTDGVVPYTAHVGDKSFLFTKRPSALQQIELAKIANEKIGAQHADVIVDIVRAMMAEPDRWRELFGLLDLEEVARLINNAMKKMKPEKGTPITGPGVSSPGPSQTTSATGSPEQAYAARS